ncbi:MAG: 50S ribosomal protein L22 [Candidatus Pacebacteria bacterium]|nr:50S ribosomal protein L22 [Candidatus Paceibacterota bacterium]
MKAILRNYRQSPRKVALAAALVRGKTAGVAITQLKFATKRASLPLIKLIESALSNARSQGVANPEGLTIQEFRVDQGVTLKRMMPRARGSGARILKRSSHVILTLGEGKLSKNAAKKAKKDASKEVASTDAKVAKAPKVTKAKKAAK